MWLSSSTITSSPGWVWVRTAHRFPIEPLGRNRDASIPTISAASSWSRLTVGSSSQTSSPTSAAAIARRMESVGRVNVSLRSSTVAMPAILRTELGIEQRACLHHLSDCQVAPAGDGDLHPGLQAAGRDIGGGFQLLRIADHAQDIR